MTEPNYIDPNLLHQQIDALTADDDFTERDATYLINWLLSKGDLTGSPRDLIQIRRGLRADLPNLAQGELAVALDTKELFVGGTNENIKINHNPYLAGKRVAVLGDSNSIGYPNAIPWTAHLQQYLEETGGQFTNFSAGGLTIGGGADVANNIGNINDYDVFIVNLGTNDLMGTVEGLSPHIRSLYNAFNGYNGDLYYITPVHREVELNIFYMTMSHVANMIYNAFAGTGKYKVINGYAAGHLDLQEDGLHLSDKGGKQLYDFIFNQINNQATHYEFAQYGYLNLPITAVESNATVILAQGLITSQINSTHYVKLTFTADATGMQVIHLNYGDCATSWLNNAFTQTSTGFGIRQPDNMAFPVVFQSIGGVHRLIFDGEAGKTYYIEYQLDVPNQVVL